MSEFDGAIAKVAAKAVLKKVDIEKVVDKAMPQIEKAIEKDLVSMFSNGTFRDVLYDSDLMDNIADVLNAELVARLGLGVKSKTKG